MRRRLWLAAAVMAVAVAASIGPAGLAPLRAETAGLAYKVIVNPQNPTVSIDRRFLVEAFLKKTTHWSHDEAIRPVDLWSDSAVRRRFSDDALSRSVGAVKSYWQQQIFSGREVPPPELDSDEAVVRFVLRYPGAIGYVSAAANVSGAKVLSIVR